MSVVLSLAWGVVGDAASGFMPSFGSGPFFAELPLLVDS